MNRSTVITTLIIISVFCMIAWCDASEFTVDERSLYHATISGGLGYAGGLLLKTQQDKNQMTDKQIVMFAGSVALIPGLFKETVMDSHIDWGDMAFNCLSFPGAWLGVETGIWLQVRKSGNTTMLSITKEF